RGPDAAGSFERRPDPDTPDFARRSLQNPPYSGYNCVGYRRKSCATACLRACGGVMVSWVAPQRGLIDMPIKLSLQLIASRRIPAPVTRALPRSGLVQRLIELHAPRIFTTNFDR